MKTKKLIILRHGEYEHGGFLTDAGREHISQQARLLQSAGHLTITSIAVLCSRELRAIKSAQTFIKALGLEKEVDEECHKELHSTDNKCDVVEALKVVQHYIDKFETIVVFTHLEMVQNLPKAVGADIPNNHYIEYGTGFVIDCARHTCEHV